MLLTHAFIAAFAAAMPPQIPPPSCPPNTALPTPKNILLIVLDDVGTDKLKVYGETPPSHPPVSCQPCPCPWPAPGWVDGYAKTPNIDALRDGGILFTNAYSNPVCSPTRSCMMTGRYAFRTGVGNITGPAVTSPFTAKLANSEVFLPELLKNGYHPGLEPPGVPYKCGAFGKWHLTTLSGDDSHAGDNGFDRFYGSIANIEVNATPPEDYFTWTKIVHDPPSAPTDFAGPNPWHGTATSTDAKDWINAQTSPFFAYVCFNPPHTPWQVPPQNLVSTSTWGQIVCAGFSAGDEALTTDPAGKRKLFYKAMLEAVDTEIGNLIHQIDAAKLANTMVIVMSDNGTPGNVMDTPPHTAGHGKASVYEWGVRVPLIVSGPLVQAPGGWVSDTPVHAVDIWPTIAAIAEVDPSRAAPGVVIDGQSFLPAIQEASQSGNRAFAFSEYFTPNHIPALPPQADFFFSLHNRSITDGRYKYIRVQCQKAQGAFFKPTYTEAFYSLLAGREETDDLLTPVPTLTADEVAILDAMRREMRLVSGY